MRQIDLEVWLGGETVDDAKALGQRGPATPVPGAFDARAMVSSLDFDVRFAASLAEYRLDSSTYPRSCPAGARQCPLRSRWEVTMPVRVYLACSVDGFIAGPDHDLSWLERNHSAPDDLPPEEGVLRFDRFLQQVGAMLMGRSTYDAVQKMGVWPYGALPVLVATHRALAAESKTVRGVGGTIHELVEMARAEAGERDIYLDGGDLVRQALSAGLVDEMTLTFVPLLLGKGIRLFETLDTSMVVQFRSHRSFDQGMLQVTMRMRRDPNPSR